LYNSRRKWFGWLRKAAEVAFLQVKAVLLLVNGENGLTAGILVLILGVARGELVSLILILGEPS
jgi:hypothetical protein